MEGNECKEKPGNFQTNRKRVYISFYLLFTFGNLILFSHAGGQQGPDYACDQEIRISRNKMVHFV